MMVGVYNAVTIIAPVNRLMDLLGNPLVYFAIGHQIPPYGPISLFAIGHQIPPLWTWTY